MRKFFATIFVLGIAGTVFYFGFIGKDQLSQISAGPEQTELPVDETAGEKIAIEPDQVFTEPIVYTSLKQAYSGTTFSFKYPDGFKVSSIPVDTSQEVITIENSKGSGFQISVMPFDESGPITTERIKKDLPDAQINDPKNAELDGIKTIVFYGYDEAIGETFETWPIYKGKMYQIMGSKTAEKLIIETLETWRWQ